MANKLQDLTQSSGTQEEGWRGIADALFGVRRNEAGDPVTVEENPIQGILARGRAQQQYMRQFGQDPGAEFASAFSPSHIGVAGIMAGRNALTANRAAFAIAEDMARLGKNREQIFSRTGLAQGVDKKFRAEISDQKAEFDLGTDAATQDYLLSQKGPNHDPGLNGGWETDVKSILNHPDLYAAYPEIGNLPVKIHGKDTDMSPEIAGRYMPGQAIELNHATAYGDPDFAKSVLLHEIQHGVQDVEGFSWGADPSFFLQPGAGRDLLHKAYPELGDFYNTTVKPLGDAAMKVAKERTALKKAGANNLGDFADTPIWQALQTAKNKYLETARSLADPAYYKAGGEVESRNVQKRMNYSDVQRQAEPPWETQEFPNEEQIVFGKDGKPLSLKPIDYDPFGGQ